MYVHIQILALLWTSHWQSCLRMVSRWGIQRPMKSSVCCTAPLPGRKLLGRRFPHPLPEQRFPVVSEEGATRCNQLFLPLQYCPRSFIPSSTHRTELLIWNSGLNEPPVSTNSCYWVSELRRRQITKGRLCDFWDPHLLSAWRTSNFSSVFCVVVRGLL